MQASVESRDASTFVTHFDYKSEGVQAVGGPTDEGVDDDATAEQPESASSVEQIIESPGARNRSITDYIKSELA